MGVRVVFAIHALVLLTTGVLWFVPRDVDTGFGALGWHRAALILTTWAGALIHLTLLLRKHRSASPARLLLPLLLPAFTGIVVAFARMRPFSEALAQDPDNRVLEALAIWAGGARVGAAVGLGAWLSGMLLLAASIGAAALMVARGWVVVPKSVLQRLAIGVALVVASTLVRFLGKQRILMPDAIAWAAVLCTISLLLLGARAGRGMGRGWQSTLLRTLGLMLPLGVVLAFGGARAIRENHLVERALGDHAFRHLSALTSTTIAMDGVVMGLVVAGAIVAAWGLMSVGPRDDRRGNLALVCCLLGWLLAIGSLWTVRSTRAHRLGAYSQQMLHLDDVKPPTLGGYEGWVANAPTVLLREAAIPALTTAPGQDGTMDLSSAVMAGIPPSYPAKPIPRWPWAGKEGGCVVGRELPGMRLPGAQLVVDQRVTMETLSAQVGPLSARAPRVFALLTLQKGADQAPGLPPPWNGVMRLASSASTLVRVESTVRHALRPVADDADRYIATPEAGGLRVVSLSGAKTQVDEFIVPGEFHPVGRCGFSVGCNAVPCEFLVGFPPDWDLGRAVALLEPIAAMHAGGMHAAYRGHHIVTLTPDIPGVRAVMKDARTRIVERGDR